MSDITVRNTIRESMYNALSLKYKSDRELARSTLMVYFNNPVAIGEHPQHLEEIDSLLSKMVDAQDKLNMLTDSFKDYSNTSGICTNDEINTNGVRRASP